MVVSLNLVSPPLPQPPSFHSYQHPPPPPIFRSLSRLFTHSAGMVLTVEPGVYFVPAILLKVCFLCKICCFSVLLEPKAFEDESKRKVVEIVVSSICGAD